MPSGLPKKKMCLIIVGMKRLIESTIAILLVLTSSAQLEACKCLPMSAKEAYCAADWGMLI